MRFAVSPLRSLKTQLFAVFWALSLAMLYYAVSAILADRQTLQALDRIVDAQQIAITSGGLAHELQKERGLSAGFISSKGEKFREALASQRQLTDQAYAAFSTLRAQIDLGQLGVSAQRKLKQADEAMRQIGDKRAAIDALQL